MSNTIIIKNREPQAISIRGGGEVLGITTVYVNGIDVTEGSVAYVIAPTKTSELTNDSGFINHEVDPTVPYYVKQITQADINSWNNKQDELVSGTNIKTINSNSLLGSGNIDISTSYSAGTGINISNENVISNTITSYDDLSDLPTIPTKTSELLNDSGYLVADDLSNVAFSGSYADLSDVPDLSEYATLDTEDLENYYTKRFMWNILPRTTGSGVSVSLSDTLKDAPIELTLSPSELSQEATPTPDSPQAVHTISGDNTIKVNNIQEADIDLGDIEYCKIGNYEDKFIRTSGKNLFDNSTSVIGYLYADGAINSASGFKTSDFIEIKPNTAYYKGYTKNGKAKYYNAGKQVLDTSTAYDIDIKGDAGTFTTPNNAYYLRFTYNDDIDSNIMINEGTTALPYEPYGSNEWYIKKNIGKVVLDGTEDWRVSNTGTPNYQLYCYVNENLGGDNQGYSNYYPVIFITGTNTNQGIVGVGHYIRLRYGEEPTIADLKTWLSSHNVILYQPLILPTYTQITGTLETQLENVYYNLTAYDNQTNISQTNNDLPFVISASTPKTLVNM